MLLKFKSQYMNSKQKKENSCSVIGATGHIGLPLSFLLAKHKFNVIGIDKDSKKIEMINKRKMPFMENNFKELFQNKKLKIKLTENINEIKKTKYIIVTLGTPIDEYLNPSYSSFFKVIDKIINLLDDSQILILRSTLAPGTTRKILEKIQKKRLKTGIAFCPERISQGNAVSEIYKLPQIISFSDLKTKKACKKIFKNFTDDIVECSFEEAEISKLFCNSWRYIKFAIANEFYKICKLHDLNFEKIRYSMMLNYPRTEDFPKSGFAAGPCLLKDTMQLASFSREQFTFGNSAMLVNESLPDFLVEKLKQEITLKNRKTLILGMAFKADNDDIRDSLAFRLRKKLKQEGSVVTCHDPYIKEFKKYTVKSLIKKNELILIGCPHKQYKNLQKNFKNKRFIDCWGFL